MEMRACLCLDTDMETIEGCGAAELNLVLRGEALPAEERQTSFTQMMEIALETAE